jgi:hypothetical protein
MLDVEASEKSNEVRKINECAGAIERNSED